MSLQSRPIALLRRYSLVIELVGTATGILAVWYFLDLAPAPLGGAAVGITAATIWPHVRRRYGFNRGWGKLFPGVGLVALGAYAFAGTGGNDLVKAAFLIVGAWLTLDAVYDLQSGAGRTEPGAPDQMDRFGDAAIVGQALEGSPRSVAELDDALDLPRERIEDGIETLRTLDVIERQGERYVARLDDRSLTDALRNESGRARERLGGLPERVARPFRLFT
ncbi:hypothetical protein BV210_00320 [Halorientalis sp. IM1011]|uniref:hypothetical protein n=1 Tax=Halorientalis sp. IM1011 TaxID=1932360 RepID=UPI00097CD220|nr:hypothetical protein [Halorientalis sp. IM1011]AQL41248.1 hypothetical protein BV210_00320 [Halorientalis sp. IM1011]